MHAIRAGLDRRQRIGEPERAVAVAMPVDPDGGAAIPSFVSSVNEPFMRSAQLR